MPAKRRVQKSGVGCGTVVLIIIFLLGFGACCFVSGAVAMYQLYQEAQAEASLPTPPPVMTPPTGDVQPSPTPAPVPAPAPDRNDREQRRSERMPTPRRPVWMALAERPSSQEIQTYSALATSVPALTEYISTSREVVNVVEARRIYEARDRLLARPTPYGLWAWREVRQAISEIGTSIPLRESDPDHQSQGCLAFYEVVFGRLAFCANGIARMSDADVEAVLVHEATHIALARMVTARSEYSASELTALVSYCADVGEEFYFTNETLAFFNQTAYLGERTSESFSLLYREDENVRAARDALLHPRTVAERYYAERIVWYINQPSENPYRYNGGRRCGQLVAVRGAHQGEYVLSLDFSAQVAQLAEHVPNFRYH